MVSFLSVPVILRVLDLSVTIIELAPSSFILH